MSGFAWVVAVSFGCLVALGVCMAAACADGDEDEGQQCGEWD